MGFNSGFKGLMKIRSLGAELSNVEGRTDGRTDMTKLVDVFRNLANAPNTAVYYL